MITEKFKGHNVDQLRDKSGKTEQEFLRDYDVTEYFRPSVTVDAILYRKTVGGLKLLMIKRGGHPFIGCYAFPGGFVERDEDCETAVARELEEETHLRGAALRQLVTVSTPGRDPRWRNITVVYCAEMPSECSAEAGDDAADAKWFDVVRSGDELAFTSGDERFTARLDIVRDPFGKLDINKTRIIERGKTAFDHAKIVMLLAEEVMN